MGKKAKGGDKGGEVLPTEAESTLLLKIAALEEKLARIQHDADSAVGFAATSKDQLAKQKKDQKDIVDYLSMQLAQKKEDYAALEERYAQLVQAKEESEKRLNQMLEDLKAELKETQSKLAASEAQCAQLTAQVVEIGQLRAGAQGDAGAKATLTAELERYKAMLKQSEQHLTVLAVAEDRIIGENGARALPLMLLEAIRLHLAKPVLVEQAMVAMQYVLSEAHGHADSELIRTRGGIDIILDAMRRHAEIAELQSSACGLLWKLAFADPPTRDIVIRSEGIALIMAGMQRHHVHPRLQYNACGALRQMLVTAPRDFSKESQIAAGTRPAELPAVGSMSGRRGRGLPQDPRSLPMRISPGGPVRIASRSNPHLQPLQGPPGSSLRSSMGGRPATIGGSGRRGDDLDPRLAAKEDVSVQALKLTLQSMAAHPETPLVQEYGCGTLLNVVLGGGMSMAQKLYGEAGVPTILEAMRTHPMATGVQIHSCALIKELAEFQPALKLIEDGGGRSLLLAALHNHQYNDELLTRATEALRYLPEELKIEL